MEAPPANDFCSVCHGSFNVPCQANCSHWFCGNCIMLVWDHSSAFQPCKCPLCRRQITLLVPTEAALRDRDNPSVAQILQRVSSYNRRFGGQSNGLIQRMQDLPFLLRRLLRELLDPQRSLPFVIRARVYIADRSMGMTIGTERESQGLYYIQPTSSVICTVVKSLELFHYRLGHPSLA